MNLGKKHGNCLENFLHDVLIRFLIRSYKFSKLLNPWLNTKWSLNYKTFTRDGFSRLIILIFGPENVDALCQWILRNIGKLSPGQMWKSFFMRSLNLFDWHFKHLQPILSSVLKGLADIYQPLTDCKIV